MNVIALAYNYKGYDRPPLPFAKMGVVGPGVPVPVPSLHTWPEPELGFIVGGGFVLANDITSYYEPNVHLFGGKCRKGYCPIIEIFPDNPQNIVLKAYINDELVVNGHTKDRILHESGALKFIEGYIDLLPDDVILTGCPLHHKAALHPKDIVRVEAWENDERIGVIENPVVAK